MLKPFFQGKLDTFCAIYAVLNALRLTHGLRVMKAREILNDTLLGLASSPEAFRAVLNQETDYIALVDGMLNVQSRVFPLEVSKPFININMPLPDPGRLWQTFLDWMSPGGGRTIIFRFLRSLSPESGPVHRHWTTVGSMSEHTIRLFDCSHEAEAILNIARDSIVTLPEDISQDRLLLIQPESVRMLRLPV